MTLKFLEVGTQVRTLAHERNSIYPGRHHLAKGVVCLQEGQLLLADSQ